MDYSKKQKELDVIKWIDSEIKNYDTCGEYDYCKNCNKNKEYPCAYAYEYYNSFITIASKNTSSKSSKKATVKKSIKSSKTTSYKTSSPKKTLKTTSASKKTTSKKSTSKAIA